MVIITGVGFGFFFLIFAVLLISNCMPVEFIYAELLPTYLFAYALL